MVCIIIITWTQ